MARGKRKQAGSGTVVLKGSKTNRRISAMQTKGGGRRKGRKAITKGMSY